MVKELDDPAGEELAVVLDARASSEVGVAPDSSFELAVAAAGSLLARAFADSRRVRLVIAGGDGEPASATERTAVRKLLARASPAGERSLVDLLTRVAAEHIEVVTSRPGALVGAGRARQLGVVAIDPSSFDPAVPRDAAALSALRAAGVRVLEIRRPQRDPAAARPARRARELALRGSVYALAGGFGLIHARDLQAPALSAPSLLAICRARDGARARRAARRPARRPARAGAGRPRRGVGRGRQPAVPGCAAGRALRPARRRAWRAGSM